MPPIGSASPVLLSSFIFSALKFPAVVGVDLPIKVLLTSGAGVIWAAVVVLFSPAVVLVVSIVLPVSLNRI